MDDHGAMILLQLQADLAHKLEHGAGLPWNTEVRPGREVVLNHLTRHTHLCDLGGGGRGEGGGREGKKESWDYIKGN